MSKVYDKTLLDDMVQHQSLPMPLVKEAAKEILEVVREGLIQDGVVKVSNFGTFRLKSVAARPGINPQTREPITIPAHQRVIFSPCKALRELIQPVHRPPVQLEPEASENTVSPAPIPPIVSSVSPSDDEERDSEPLPTVVESPVKESQSQGETEALHTSEEEPTVPQYEPEPPITLNNTVSLDESGGETPAHHGNSDSDAASQDGMEDVASLSLGKEKETSETAVTEEPVSAPESKTLVHSEAETIKTSSGETAKHQNHRDSEKVALDIGEIDRKESSSKKRYYLGAAAVLVLALIGAFLLMEPENSEDNSPISGRSLASQVEAASPLTHTAETVAEPPESEEVAVDSQPPVEASALIEDTASPSVQEVSKAEATSEPIIDDKVLSQTELADNLPPEAQPVQPPETSEEASETAVYFAERQHELSYGESLWRLARKHYHDPLLWPHIYRANKESIDNPDELREGRTLVLPALQGSPGKLSRSDRRSIAEGYYLTYLYYKEIGKKEAFFALLEAKRYDSDVVEKHESLLHLSLAEKSLLRQQQTMPF